MPMAMADTSSCGLTDMSAVSRATPKVSLRSALTDSAMPRATKAPAATPRSDPAMPITALSPRNNHWIWPRVAPSARRMAISDRRSVTATPKAL